MGLQEYNSMLNYRKLVLISLITESESNAFVGGRGYM